MLAFLVAYPLASAMRRLPSTAAKHALALAAGVLFLAWACDRAALYPLATVASSYGILRVAPAAHAPWLVLVVTLAFLTFAHLRRMALSEADAWDFSGPQMVLTIKLSNLAFELYDGVRLKRAGGEGAPASAAGAHPKESWRPERLERAITRRPSLLEFGGYAFFFGSVLVGPAFDYLEYSSAITGSKYRRLRAAPGSGGAGQAGQAGVHRPSAERAYFRLLAQALLFLAVHLALERWMPIRALRSPAFLTGGTLLSRALWVYLCMLAERCKYYFVWLVTEGACMSAGFGWVYARTLPTGSAPGSAAESDADLAGAWTGVSNIDPWGFESADSIRQASVRWNKHTSTWLRRCVYERVPGPARLVATYAVSAMWHGFHPGYYVFFLSAAAGQAVNNVMRARARPWFLAGAPLARYKRWYDAAGVVSTAFLINYLAPAFVLNTLHASHAIWSSLDYSGHILTALVGIVAFVLVRPPPRRVAQ